MARKTGGFLIPHRVGPTADMGLGVFARSAIAQGTRIWRYTPGHYAVYDEVRFRAVLTGMSHARARYALTHVFGLAEFPGCVIRIFDDGARVNHAAAPNMRTDHRDEAPPTRDPETATAALLHDRFSLVAVRDIAAGEELFLNYADDVSDPAFYHQLCAEYGVEEDYF